MNPFIDAFAGRVREIGFDAHVNMFDPRDERGVSNFRPDHFPYAVIAPGLEYEFSGNGRWDGTLADIADGIELPIRVTMSGLTVESVQVLQDKIRPAMNRADLDVDGWTRTRLKMTPLSRLTEDTTVTVGNLYPWFAVDEYRLIARRS